MVTILLREVGKGYLILSQGYETYKTSVYGCPQPLPIVVNLNLKVNLNLVSTSN